MFEILIREVGARFGVGDKALPLLQMLLAYMTNKETGGLAGFLEKFKAAGLGPLVQSWLGGGPAGQPLANSQVETVLGSSGGLLSQVTSKLSLDRESVASSLGYLIPVLVGKLTPGGSIPSTLPPEVVSLAAAGQNLLAAPAVTSASSAEGGAGWLKWLPWVIVVIAALLGLNYCSKSNVGDAPPAVAPAAPAEPESSAPMGTFGPGPAVPAASEPAGAATEGGTGVTPAAPGVGEGSPSGPSPSVAVTGSVAGSAGDEPAGAAVVGWTSSDAPALKVYFETGSAGVSSEFAEKASEFPSSTLRTHFSPQVS